MQPDFREINGAACRYQLTGAGEPLLVLIHELGGSLNSWDGLVATLPAGRRVLRYDLRGAGLSEKVRGRQSLDTLADDLAALLDHLQQARPVVVLGAAMGGTVAIRFATRFPERIARLVLVGPALGVPPERREASAAICDRLDAEGMRVIADAVLPKAFPEDLWGDADARRLAIARWLGADPEGYAASYRILIEESVHGELPRIACPTLVLAGRHDPFSPPDVMQAAAKAIPQGRFAVVEGGHFAAVQSPARLAEVIASFVEPSEGQPS